MGKLGQLTQEAPIYVKPDKRARVLYRGKAQLYVVLRNLTEDWATLVMADGSSGYVEAKFVESLPYEVNVKDTPSRLPAVASRGGFERPQITGDDTGSRICRNATNYIGTPYKWGGNSLTGGIDCSGFVQQLFRVEGISLPRTAQEQSYVGMPVDNLGELQAGDRLYFTDSDRSRITHTGIYIGSGYFIHSSTSNKGVAIDALQGKWLNILVNCRR